MYAVFRKRGIINNMLYGGITECKTLEEPKYEKTFWDESFVGACVMFILLTRNCAKAALVRH